MLQNTTFGSSFMSSPVGLCELGHALRHVLPGPAAEHQQAGLAEQLDHRGAGVTAWSAVWAVLGDELATGHGIGCLNQQLTRAADHISTP